MTALLAIDGLHAGYGRTEVLRDVSFTVAPGEVVALVGANGAGKSTLVKAISGLLRPTVGSIRLEGTPVHALPVSERVRRGIVHVPEGRQVFAGLSARENLRLGAWLDRTDLDARIDAACAPFPDVANRLDAPAGSFSGGQQQMLAIARGLMARPRLLLLDEPSLGLSPMLVADVFALVASLRTRGIAVLLAEQNARAALAIADRGIVLENGAVVMQGTGAELLASPDVAAKYLGTGAGERARGTTGRIWQTSSGRCCSERFSLSLRERVGVRAHQAER